MSPLGSAYTIMEYATRLYKSLKASKRTCSYGLAWACVDKRYCLGGWGARIGIGDVIYAATHSRVTALDPYIANSILG